MASIVECSIMPSSIEASKDFSQRIDDTTLPSETAIAVSQKPSEADEYYCTIITDGLPTRDDRDGDSGFASADEEDNTIAEVEVQKTVPLTLQQQHTCLYCKDLSDCPTNPINRRMPPIAETEFRVNKLWSSAEAAIADMDSNTTLLSGGFGLCGVPDTLIEAVRKHSSINGLTVVSNNAGTDTAGLGLLLASRQIRKMISSFIGDNKTFERQYLAGELELELTPQGTLVERCRAGGAGIPAFFTASGCGTVVQTGELPLKYNPDGTVAAYTPPRDVKIFDGKPYVMEEAIKGDYAFVKAWKADTLGNCQFRYSAWNFNAAMGRAAKCTIVEAEHIVQPGEIDPSAIHLPGIFVNRLVQSTSPKHIERLIYAPESGIDLSMLGTGETARKRERIARRVAKEFKHGMHVNLGIGIPMLAPAYVDPGIDVYMQSENGILGVEGLPKKGEEDADIIVAGKWPVTLKAGAACFSTEDSFAMIRSGRIDMTILGAMQVNARGDLANWMLPGKVKGFGGAMDLVSNPTKTKVVVLTEHTDKHGRPKIVKQCDFPLTGKNCVSRIITDLAVFDVDSTKGLTLMELADHVTLEDVKAKTGATFAISQDLRTMQL